MLCRFRPLELTLFRLLGMNLIVTEWTDGRWKQHKFGSLYTWNSGEAADQRMRIKGNDWCNPSLVRELSTFMSLNNSFSAIRKIFYGVEWETINDAVQHGVEPATVTLAIIQDCKYITRWNNAPTRIEVTVIF